MSGNKIKPIRIVGRGFEPRGGDELFQKSLEADRRGSESEARTACPAGNAF